MQCMETKNLSVQRTYSSVNTSWFQEVILRAAQQAWNYKHSKSMNNYIEFFQGTTMAIAYQ